MWQIWHDLASICKLGKYLACSTHCEFRLRNGRGKTCLWKKYILVYLHRQKQGKKNFWLPTLSFWATSQTAPVSQLIGLDFMVHASPALKRTMYEFKNYFFPNFLLIHKAKYIFSRDMFCICNFRAKIHGVIHVQRFHIRISPDSALLGINFQVKS